MLDYHQTKTQQKNPPTTPTPDKTIKTTDQTPTPTYSITQNTSQKNESNYQVIVTISKHPQGDSVAIIAPSTTFPIVTENETITEPKQFTVSNLQPGDTVQLQVGDTILETYTVTE